MAPGDFQINPLVCRFYPTTKKLEQKPAKRAKGVSVAARIENPGGFFRAVTGQRLTQWHLCYLRYLLFNDIFA